MKNYLTGALVAIICCACDLKSAGKERVTSQPSGHATFCVGRHLIDVPKNFILAKGTGGTFIVGGAGDED